MILVKRKRRIGLADRARSVKSLYDRGLSIVELSRETGLGGHELEDLLDLAECDDFFSRCLNRSRIAPMFARMLWDRYSGWIRTGQIRRAKLTAHRLLRRARRESITMKTWRFYLDFYHVSG